MNQTWENKKNLILDPTLVCLAQISIQNFFLGGFTSTSS